MKKKKKNKPVLVTAPIQREGIHLASTQKLQTDVSRSGSQQYYVFPGLVGGLGREEREFLTVRCSAFGRASKPGTVLSLRVVARGEPPAIEPSL